MKSEGHFWASLNYVLHNAVRHGYVQRWQEWPYSNAEQYLGKSAAKRPSATGTTYRCTTWQRVGPAGVFDARMEFTL